MELGVIKNDVVNELRSELYYNELEIGRVAQSATISHKERVDVIIRLTRDNANIVESLKLLEAYFPTKQAAPAQPEQPAQ
jgi:hypothetical protein